MAKGLNKKALKDLIDGLPEDSVRLAKVITVLTGIDPPYVLGAEPPAMQKTKKKSEVGGEFNPLWLIEVRDNYVQFNRDWFNYYGHQWPLPISCLRL